MPQIRDILLSRAKRLLSFDSDRGESLEALATVIDEALPALSIRWKHIGELFEGIELLWRKVLSSQPVSSQTGVSYSDNVEDKPKRLHVNTKALSLLVRELVRSPVLNVDNVHSRGMTSATAIKQISTTTSHASLSTSSKPHDLADIVNIDTCT